MRSVWLHRWLLGAFIVTRNPFSRTLSTLLVAGAILSTRLLRESLAGDILYNCSASAYQLYARWLLCALVSALCPPSCSATSLVIRHLSGHGHSLGCLAPRYSVPFHPFGLLLASRNPRGHSALPGYSAPHWLLDALRCPPSHSATSCLF